jgi:hypothetical protein
MSKSPAFLLATFLLVLVSDASSQERVPVVVGEAGTVRTVLFKQTGRQVTLLLDSGQELTGVVKELGDKVIHLTGLVGKEYFDAVVDIEKVTAVLVRVR